MRRAKLAPGSLPPGSLPATSWYKIPRCFVCDETIKSHRLSTSLLAGQTQYSCSPLPTKIGGYIGDNFVVVVTPQDALCKHCMALINTMDRLEQELRQHQNTLILHLKTKYRLDASAASQIKNKEDADHQEDNHKALEVSDDGGTPSKKLRTETWKQHRCTICNESFGNLSLFMAHLSRHKLSAKSNINPASIPAALSRMPPGSQSKSKLCSMDPSSSDSSIDGISYSSFKCGCCTQSFLSKEKLVEHMQVHTLHQTKSSSASSIQVKPDSILTSQQSSEEAVQASALFQDIELLPQPDIPVASSMCSEEQKGRVCLLALLNNGVCSDLNHRQPTASDVIAMNNELQESVSNKQPSVSASVSIPSDLNFLELEQPPTLLDNALVTDSTAKLNNGSGLTTSRPQGGLNLGNETSRLCVLPSKSCEVVGGGMNETKIPQEIRKKPNCKSAEILDDGTSLVTLHRSCLNMPDLSGTYFKEVPTCDLKPTPDVPSFKVESTLKWSAVKSTENPCKSVCLSVTNSDSPFISNCHNGNHDGVHDMPNLLDDSLQIMTKSENLTISQKKMVDMVHSFTSSENLATPIVSDSCPDLDNCTKTDVKGTCRLGNQNSFPDENFISLQGTLSCGTGIQKSSNVSRRTQETVDSMKNIAIVSVKSVPINGSTLSADYGASDWFYSNSNKDVKSCMLKVCDDKSSFHHPWLEDFKEPLKGENSTHIPTTNETKQFTSDETDKIEN